MKNFDFITNPTTLKQVTLADSLRHCLGSAKAKYSINVDKSMKQLFSDYVNEIYRSGSSVPAFRYREDIVSTLRELGISGGADIKELLLFIKNSGNPLFKTPLTKIVFGNLPKPKSVEYIARDSRIGMDTTRTIVVRSKYGKTQPLFYELQGSTSNVNEISKIKRQYTEDTGCNYYEARPILLSTWDTLDDARKIGTCICDAQD